MLAKGHFQVPTLKKMSKKPKFEKREIKGREINRNEQKEERQPRKKKNKTRNEESCEKKKNKPGLHQSFNFLEKLDNSSFILVKDPTQKNNNSDQPASYFSSASKLFNNFTQR